MQRSEEKERAQIRTEGHINNTVLIFNRFYNFFKGGIYLETLLQAQHMWLQTFNIASSKYVNWLLQYGRHCFLKVFISVKILVKELSGNLFQSIYTIRKLPKELIQRCKNKSVALKIKKRKKNVFRSYYVGQMHSINWFQRGLGLKIEPTLHRKDRYLLCLHVNWDSFLSSRSGNWDK